MYNPFIDLYVDPKTKVVLSLIDSLILTIFYSSLTDFYYLGPYLLNLISSIKFLCNSKEITGKIINENFLDINTMICDLIGFFNGFTRALCQDYNCYLGCDAIYNERCFLHLRKNNNDSLLVMCRERSGSNDYFQLKSLGQIKSKQRDKIQSNEEEKIEVKNSNILMIMKYKKKEKKNEYINFDYNNYKKRKFVYDEENKVNDNNNDLMNQKMENSMITNNLDLPSESQLFDEDDNENNDGINNNGNDSEQILEVFDFINNVTKKNGEIDINYDKEDKVDKNNKLSNSFNNKKPKNFVNTNNYEKFKHQKSHEIKKYNNDNRFEIKKIEPRFYRNQTINFDKSLTLKNMELIKNIDFDDLNNDEISDDNTDQKKENNRNYNNINYKDIEKESLINNFNQINNNYIDEEVSQIFLNNKAINFDFSNNKNNFNNNLSSNNYKINHNNIFYPIQNLKDENNFNINNNQPIIPYFPQLNMDNNNNINNFNFSNNNHSLNQFSQNDLSFLSGYSKTENFKEDFIKINKSNPEIISELKEKLCFYYSLFQTNKLMNISLKGYIGINIRPNNMINNKEFYINFFTEKWKENNYFLNREFNKKIEQITENIYKIRLLKQSKAVKLITYLVNQNIIVKFDLIQTQIKINNNFLIYQFYYSNNICEHVKKIEIILEYKNNFQMFNQIASDGNIIQSDNIKTNIIYQNSIKEGKVSFPINNIYFYIKKIIIQVVLKKYILSDMNCKISFSNSISQSQESLPCKKSSLLSFQYE